MDRATAYRTAELFFAPAAFRRKIDKPVYRRDYILRLIERFGRMLIALRNRILRREIDTADVVAELRDIAQQAGLDLALARQLDPAMLAFWLAPTDDVDEPKLWLMAELLYLEGLQARSAGEEWRSDFARALAIFGRLPADWRPADHLATAGERRVELRQLLESDTSSIVQRDDSGV
jgi:hypothetical protein